jgi:hypothetical protein
VGRGRWFEAASGDPSGAPTTVLAHSMWRDCLGSDPDVLGSLVRINCSTVTGGPEIVNGGQGPASVEPFGCSYPLSERRGRAWPHSGGSLLQCSGPVNNRVHSSSAPAGAGLSPE